MIQTRADSGACLQEEIPLPKPQQQPVPVLVLGGRADVVQDEDGCRQVADWTGGTLVMLPDTAHQIMLVRFQQVLAC